MNISKMSVIRLCAGTVGLGLLIPAGLLHGEDVDSPLREGASGGGVTVPIALYENGEVRGQIRIESVAQEADGIMDAKGVTLSFYNPDGSSDAVMTADSCKFNNAEKTAVSEGRVRMQKESVVITGKGFEWSSASEKVWIKHDVRVEFSGMPMKGLLPELGGRHGSAAGGGN